jgi:ribosomal protein L11 methyltransferase
VRVDNDVVTARYTVPTRDETERLLAASALWNAGASGVWERDDDVVGCFETPTAAVPPGGRWDEEPERDWLEEWKAGLEPVRVGDLVIAPSWHSQQSEPSTVVIDPGMAFGTGHHPTTRMCLAALQAAGVTGRSVLDVGTGSGILAVAAATLGAAPVVAVDTDPDAVTVARDNARANRVEVDVRLGSLETLHPREVFDVVVANLTTAELARLAQRLVAVTRIVLVTSGIATDRVEEARTALSAANVRIVEDQAEEGWATLTCRPRHGR